MVSKSLFDNTEAAFKLKSDSELERAYFLFKMIANEPLVKIGTAVTKFALNINLPVEGLVRSTVFDHFCGGVNENDCIPVVDKMYNEGVISVLDYSVEGKEEESQFDMTMNKVLELTKFAEIKQAMPFSVFKPTGFGRFEIWQKVTENKPLNDSEKEEWNRIVQRFDSVCKAAYETGITLLIDA
ncbi:MAG: proline dehydrogenase, partial [Flavobacteriaceae bacterium]